MAEGGGREVGESGPQHEVERVLEPSNTSCPWHLTSRGGNWMKKKKEDEGEGGMKNKKTETPKP